jgi:hypothetical protein
LHDLFHEEGRAFGFFEDELLEVLEGRLVGHPPSQG